MNQEPERLQLVAKDDDELLGIVGHSPRENPPLLPSSIQEVDAICQKVQIIHFSGDRDPKLEFTFQIVEPEQYAGTRLAMYARKGPWKALPVRSKLWKLAKRATEGQFRRKQRITKSLFVGKIFLCTVRSDQSGDYTVIDMIVKKLTG